jgi:hypothetical protein
LSARPTDLESAARGDNSIWTESGRSSNSRGFESYDVYRRGQIPRVRMQHSHIASDLSSADQVHLYRCCLAAPSSYSLRTAMQTKASPPQPGVASSDSCRPTSVDRRATARCHCFAPRRRRGKPHESGQAKAVSFPRGPYSP